MAKPHSQYVCQQCGYSQVGWAGKCPNCNTWGSLVETFLPPEGTKDPKSRGKNGTSKYVELASLENKSRERIVTKISELDRVLGGGLVTGQVVLLAGDPGIGKSTILLQVAEALKGKVLYASGEESGNQIKIRAERMGIKNDDVKILEENDIDSIVDLSEAEKDTVLLIVDSIQTVSTGDLTGMAGSPGQVRECAARLVRFAKTRGIPVVMVGHVTKEGTVAGPSVLAHIVDTVLWFEGDKALTLRLLRAVKNRFGPTDEVGIFTMEEKGLVSVTNPEAIFMSDGKKKGSGSITTLTLQGTRPVVVEIQALVVPSKMAFPKRVAQGIDSKRFELLLAILQRRAGVPLYDYDCFVNVTGGITIKETGVDLAVCLAMASAFSDKAIPEGTIALGEVDLLGNIRSVTQQQKRIKEAKRLGFKVVISDSLETLRNAIKKTVN